MTTRYAHPLPLRVPFVVSFLLRGTLVGEQEAEEESKQRIALFASEYDTPPSSTSSLLSWKHTSSSSSDENYHPERSGHARIASISAPPSGGANKGSPAENVGGRQLSTLSGSAMKNQAVAMGAHGRRRGRRPGQGHGRGLVRRQRAGFVEQFRLLLARSWRQVNRAKFANITRVSFPARGRRLCRLEMLQEDTQASSTQNVWSRCH